MVRKIIKPTSESIRINIPREYINKEVEILVFPFTYEKKENEIDADILKEKNNPLDFSQYQIKAFKNIEDPVKWQRSIRDEWN